MNENCYTEFTKFQINLKVWNWTEENSHDSYELELEILEKKIENLRRKRRKLYLSYEKNSMLSVSVAILQR